MKQWKKIIAAVLMCAMVVSLGGPLSEVSQAAMPTVETVYFEETFDDATLSQWSSSTLSACKECVTVKGEDGVFYKPASTSGGTQLSLFASDVSLSNYTVSCEITLGVLEDGSNPTSFITGIATRVTNASNGYEFQFGFDKGAGIARLRDRANGNNILETNTEVNISAGATYDVKMECKGNNIKCYLGTELVIDYVDNEQIYSAGSGAIRAMTSNGVIDVTYDDFKIYDVVVRDYKFCDDFNGYNAESTPAQKKQALEANDWYIASNPNAEYINGNSYVIPADSTAPTIVLQTENAKGALGWNDYSVETDITIGDGTLTSAVHACVTGRHTVAGGNDGYEIRLYEGTDGTQELQIYARNAGSIIASCPFSFERGKAYNLKAVFQDDEIYAYVDGVLYLTAASDAYPIGYAGIRKIGASCGVDVTFDNFVVYDYDVVPATFAEDFNSYTPTEVAVGSGTGWDITELNTKGWHSNSNGTMRNYAGYYAVNGMFKVPANTTTTTDMVLSKHNLAANWKNYTVECDVTFNSDGDNAASGKYTYAIIAGRETDYRGTGYGIALGATYEGKIRYIRLYQNGKTATAIADDDIVSVDIAAANRVSAGTTVNVKLEFSDTKIVGYVNGEPKVKLTLASESDVSSGYAGIHTTCDDSTGGGVDVTFDNFIVYDNDNPYVKEIVGDINADTSVNAEDTTALKDNLLSGTLENTALDVNKNNATNIFDYVRMKRLVYSLEH